MTEKMFEISFKDVHKFVAKEENLMLNLKLLSGAIGSIQGPNPNVLTRLTKNLNKIFNTASTRITQRREQIFSRMYNMEHANFRNVTTELTDSVDEAISNINTFIGNMINRTVQRFEQLSDEKNINDLQAVFRVHQNQQMFAAKDIIHFFANDTPAKEIQRLYWFNLHKVIQYVDEQIDGNGNHSATSEYTTEK